MANLKTTWMGLELDNPIIVGSSGLTSSLELLMRCEDAGAAAVVIRSVFEEEVRRDYERAVLDHLATGHLESISYQLPDLENLSEGKRYLELIEEAASTLAIPVIASVSAYSSRSWANYSKALERAGARAIEVNLNEFSASAVRSSDQVEVAYSEAAAAVLKKTTVPVAVKLPPHLTNVSYLAHQLELEGAGGLVLFNRPFLPDIDIEEMELKGGVTLSQASDHKVALRWISLLSSRLGCDLCSAGGIHDGETIVKHLLAGASAVQVVSALYRMDLNRLQEMLNTLWQWMERHGFDTIDAFRGRLSGPRVNDVQLLEKTQYSRIEPAF
jgi:dihydroorotate dehydrogenase (fumarate)